jgi:arylsulfatase A-like enzyme
MPPRPAGRPVSITALASALSLGLALAILTALTPVAAAKPAPPTHPRPNLVLILADDLGWGDLGCYNPESRIPTPHLDRLAHQGLRFLDAHSPSAVCTPTRYALLTGRYAWRTRLTQGVLWGYSPPLIEPNRPTLPAFLQTAGYQTAAIGKWHLGLRFATREPAEFGDATQPAADPALIDWHQPLPQGPRSAGFNTFFGIPASLDMVPYVYIENDHVTAPPSVLLAGDRSQRQGGRGFWRAGPASPGFSVESCLPTLADRAVAFLRNQSPNQPFFLYFPLTSPHDPWVPTPEFQGRTRAGPRGDFVAQTDAVVGRILHALEERGLADNTLVIFTSDNGAHWLPAEVRETGHAANGPWRGMKSDAYEGGHRVPFIARWPARIRPDTTSPTLIGLHDLFATMADLLRQPLPPDAAPDSLSFLPALDGHRHRRPQPLVLHSIRGTFALRHGPWKWINAPDSGGWSPGRVDTPSQLYHLGRDPSETNNLAASHPKRVRTFHQRLTQLRLPHPTHHPRQP